jgi:exosome complex RNA-binding protein Rrp42 (RNase PH superfamily)
VGQLGYISIAVNAAFRDFRLPQVVVTQDQVTNSVDVDLLENVVDAPGADKLTKVNTKLSPLLVLLGVSGDNLIFDCNEQETLWIDSILLISFNKLGKIFAIETIGPSIKVDMLKKGIKQIESMANNIFEFYELN